jgi:CubicO group peptidase (beta-lactamase class C family)
VLFDHSALRQTVILLCLAVIVNPGAAPADDLRDFIEARMKEQHLPGLSMAVTKNGRIVDARGFGLANLETATPTSPSSVFELASLSKPFTATGILMLAQEQKLSPDDLVSQYIPEVPAQWGRVTIRHLLSHTSGIEDPIDSVADPVKDRTRVEMLGMITQSRTRFRPGEEWAYNNSG